MTVIYFRATKAEAKHLNERAKAAGMSRREYLELTVLGREPPKTTCVTCGKELWLTSRRKVKGKRHSCSDKCRYAAFAARKKAKAKKREEA